LWRFASNLGFNCGEVIAATDEYDRQGHIMIKPQYYVQVSFLTAFLLGGSVSFAASKGKCEGLLTEIASAPIDRRWEQIFTPLHMTSKEKDRARSYAQFFVEAFAWGESGRALSELTSDFINQQMEKLVQVAQDLYGLAEKLDWSEEFTSVLLKNIQLLKSAVGGGKSPTLGNLIMFQFIAARFEEQIREKDSSSDTRVNHDVFSKIYDYSVDQAIADLNYWVLTGQLNNGVVADFLDTMNKEFATKGLVTLPVNHTVSIKDQLAVGFLPVAFLRFQLEPQFVQYDTMSGSDLFAWDLSLEYASNIYSQPVGELSRGEKIAALNKSWKMWVTILGVESKKKGLLVESVLQANLYSMRYPISESSRENYPVWGSAESVLNLILNEFYFRPDDDYLQIRNLMDYMYIFGARKFSTLFESRFLGPIESPLIIEAEDVMFSRIARVARHEVVDPKLLHFVEKVPYYAFSTKWLILDMDAVLSDRQEPMSSRMRWKDGVAN